MSRHTSHIDFADWPLSQNSRHSSTSQESDSASVVTSRYTTPSTPRTSPPGSDRVFKSVSGTTTIDLHPAVTLSFVKGSRQFKIRYPRLDICKDASGGLRCIELTDGGGLSGSFIHSFPDTRLPIPHLEQPIQAGQKPSLVVSFLDEQTVQTSQNLFSASPHYVFDDWNDCIRFQETILDQRIVFVAGIAGAKSKGRGEECISQNLRILRARNGRQTIIFFANSQRKEKKRYISIPLDCIEKIDQGKKAGRPVTIDIRPNFEHLAQFKNMQIQFLDDNDRLRFCAVLFQGIGFGA